MDLEQSAPMADQATERITIDASRRARAATSLLDFERYPEWAKRPEGGEVLERDDAGRGVRSSTAAAALGRSTSYTLALRLLRGPGRALAGSSSRATSCAGSTAPTRFDADGRPGATDVTTSSTVELVVPLPGLHQAPGRGQASWTRALKELKATESRARELASCGSCCFTGKGGVGKTTGRGGHRAALRRRRACARSCCRPIPRTRWPTRSTSPLGDRSRAESPTGLWGQQLDAQARIEEAWDEVQRYLVDVLDWAGVDGDRGRGARGRSRASTRCSRSPTSRATPTSGE